MNTTTLKLDSQHTPLHRHGLRALLATLLVTLAACGSAVVHRSATAEARLVAIGPSVWVVEDHHEAVFYAEGTYWRHVDGVWYQSDNYLDGYVRVETAPTVIIEIEQPQRYVRYTAPAGAETRPVVRGNGRGRAVGHAHAPGQQADHQTGHDHAPGHGHDKHKEQDKAARQAERDADKAERDADKAEMKADKAEAKAEKKAEIAERKEEKAEAVGSKQAQKDAKQARKDADKAEKKAEQADKKAEKAEKKAEQAEKKAEQAEKKTAKASANNGNSAKGKAKGNK